MFKELKSNMLWVVYGAYAGSSRGIRIAGEKLVAGKVNTRQFLTAVAAKLHLFTPGSEEAGDHGRPWETTGEHGRPQTPVPAHRFWPVTESSPLSKPPRPLKLHLFGG